MIPLWTSADIAAATNGTASADFVAYGVTFDSREIVAGDLFVAMPGTAHDGHEFVAQAFAAGAAGALVSHPIDQPHVLVADVADALIALGRAARERTSAKVIGVTGSVGKTSIKEALFEALDRGAPGRAHRSVKSYNNHTGVPLSLARMPRDSLYAVLEMGMNNAGEIANLTRQVRPHLALVTAIAPAHIETLGSMEAIADAKAEIFEGLEPDGTAIIPDTTPYRSRLLKVARRHAGQTIGFGGDDSDIRAIHAVAAEHGGSLITAALMERELTFTISQRGDHWVANALAVLAAVEAVGGDCAIAGLALADMGGLKGRGERHRVAVEGGDFLLIDESYNANPASMAATLRSLGEERGGARRIAVLGPMRELGEHSDSLHAGLAPSLLESKIDLAILIGPELAPLAEALGGQVMVERAADVDEATALLRATAKPGDAVLVKASNTVGLARLVDALSGSA